jgi:hypothetical protein
VRKAKIIILSHPASARNPRKKKNGGTCRACHEQFDKAAALLTFLSKHGAMIAQNYASTMIGFANAQAHFTNLQARAALIRSTFAQHDTLALYLAPLYSRYCVY